MKKYRLKINYSEINKGNLDAAYHLSQVDGEIGHIENEDLEDIIFGSTTHYYFIAIPESWLTEIKEPLSFGEWEKNYKPIDHWASLGSGDLLNSWNAAIENYKLSQKVDKVKDEQSYANRVHENDLATLPPLKCEQTWYARDEK